MVLKPKSVFFWDFWNSNTSEYVELSCLMPNSCFVPLKVHRDSIIAEIKDTLWVRASKLPLSDRLLHKSFYVFQFVNSLATHEEATDENVRLCDLKPTCGIFKIVKRKGRDNRENALNAQISHVIGRDLKHFETLNCAEINDFRMRIRHLANQHSDRKKSHTWLQRLLECCPVRLAGSSDLPAWLAKRLGSTQEFQVEIKFENTEDATHYIFNVPNTVSPQRLVSTAFIKRAINQRSFGFEGSEKCILKVCGQEQYVVGSYPLIQFTYIQETLAQNKIPKLIAINVESLAQNISLDRSTVLAMKPVFTCKTRNKTTVLPTYRINDKFYCSVLSVCKLNLDASKLMEVVVQVGLFHGGKQLCEHQFTSGALVAKGVARWEEQLKFSITISNLPQMARLCFVIYEKPRPSKVNGKRSKDFITPLAWANTTVFDHNHFLKRDIITMHMWPYPDKTMNEDLLHPMGTVALNPNTEQCVTMTVDFGSYSVAIPVKYVSDPDLNNLITMKNLIGANETDFEKSIKGMEQNPFYEMHEQDWSDLWDLRMSLPQLAPKLLPKLLQSADWGNRDHVICIHQLMMIWPILSVETSLELLDYAYPDPAVRKFAVQCLQHVSDEEISLYLLQLVQALKHESYLMCDLVIFLLNRAFTNMKIGHFMFWHLRSEIDCPPVSIRFQLILEAYCRGCSYHLPILIKQVNCLEKLIHISKVMREIKDLDSARSLLPTCLKDNHCDETMRRFVNTVNPSYLCKCIVPDKCRVMDSKMRPLLLVFENSNPYGEDIRIILKNGDDLRQDMFTLQMLRIMDRIWKNEGYDFRLNLYGCIAMGNRVGMIEVVRDAQTIANIQKEKGSLSPMQQGWLLSWLKSNIDDEDTLDKAVSDFMWSCAGYCVATYVLGVADRHSDNIMIKRCGQLFHIDFGHILGHFKEKFGFRRERVPFVLSHEFVNVINKGIKQDSKEFSKFRQLCEEAFIVLRKSGTLIVSLFSMMISTGLPELSSEKDLQYLKETLALGCSEVDAKIHFHSKFDEALSNDWTTSLNWVVHNISRNNKQ